jgi:AraC-like DNA-binding protein
VSEQFPPSRDLEFADRSYRMTQYLWFRVVGKMQTLAYPFYLGKGVAFDPRYNIADVKQNPMPDHVVIKVCLTRGGAVATGPQKRMLQAGDVILRFVEEADFWEGYHPNHRGTWEFVGLILAGDSATSVTRSMINKYGHIYSLGLDHPMIRRLTTYFRESEVAHEITASAGARLCHDLLLALLESAEAISLARAGVVDLADAVEASLQNDLKRDWSMSDLASIHHVSREHLTRVFTRRFGVSPHRYLVELRIREACRRLRSSNEPVKRIVLDLGFKSHANFIRVFRQYTHSSPTAYRAGH